MRFRYAPDLSDFFAGLAVSLPRLFIWCPVAMGVGIGFYFALPFEPPLFLTLPLALCLMGLPVLFWPWRGESDARMLAWIVMAALGFTSLGLTAAQIRTQTLSTIMLEDSHGPATVSGRVLAVEALPGGARRLILDRLSIEDLPPEDTPARLRLTDRIKDSPDLYPGDHIEVLAGLNAPSAPVAPNAFDFQRYAYFHNLGAFGFTYRAAEIVQDGGERPWLELIRDRVQRAISDASSNERSAAVMIALLTGERSGLDKTDLEAIRDAGIAHMLAISGLHVGLVSGIVFVAVRFLLILIPGFALMRPIKKYAAAAALLAACLYTILVGWPVTAVRALFMAGIVLLAVMLDRTAISLRLVALAACLVLLLWPESLMGASFQMSFAAVTALIVFYAKMRPFWQSLYRQAGPLRRGVLYVFGTCITTIVATLATAPFALYHFQHLAWLSLPANIAAVPILGFVVMPAAVLGLLLIPFNLAAPAFYVMEQGVMAILKIAEESAAIPYSVLYLPVWPLPVFLLMVLGGLLLMIGWGRGRYFGVISIILALGLGMAAKPPDILIGPGGKLVALRHENGVISVNSRQRERFVAENWLRLMGRYGETPERWPKEGQSQNLPGLQCDIMGCHFKHKGLLTAISYSQEAQRQDCQVADIIISFDPIFAVCDAPVKIGRFDTWESGSHAIWLDDDRVKALDTVAGTRGQRPWTVSSGR